MSRKTQVLLLNLTILLILGFIWGNSMMTAQESGGMSSGILAWLGEFIPFFAGGAHHTFLRKLAHFSEFFLLGVVCSAQRVKSEKLLSFGLISFGLISACIDETIQTFVPDRGPSLIDVWIDSAGFVTGLLPVMLGYTLIRKKNNYNH